MSLTILGKQLLFNLSIACILVCSVAGTCSSQETDNAAKLMKAQTFIDHGITAITQGKYEDAYKSFQKAVAIMPNHAEALFYLGMCLYKQGKYEEALEQFQTAKDKYLEWFAQMDQDKLQKYSEDRNLAIQYVQYIGHQEARGQTVPHAMQEKLNDLSRQGTPTLGKAEIPADYYFFCGNCLMKLRKYNESFKEFSEAIKVQPEYGAAHNNIAILYYLAKDYANSWKHLQLAKEYGAVVNTDFEKTLLSKMQK
jgi:tetratricopeptide (TPR) repeat protein